MDHLLFLRLSLRKADLKDITLFYQKKLIFYLNVHKVQAGKISTKRKRIVKSLHFKR
jgi:hypothetical protein